MRPKPTSADILGVISKAESSNWMDPVDRPSSGGKMLGADFVTPGLGHRAELDEIRLPPSVTPDLWRIQNVQDLPMKSA